jgi:hypothetical protein
MKTKIHFVLSILVSSNSSSALSTMWAILKTVTPCHKQLRRAVFRIYNVLIRIWIPDQDPRTRCIVVLLSFLLITVHPHQTSTLNRYQVIQKSQHSKNQCCGSGSGSVGSIPYVFGPPSVIKQRKVGKTLIPTVL